MPEPAPPVVLTPRRAVVVAGILGAVVGWVVLSSANAFDFTPQVPWTAPVAVGLMAALVGALASNTRQRIHVRRERMDPQRAVAFLVLGKASALGGAFVAGGYIGFGLQLLGRLDAAGPRDRVIASGFCVLAGIGLGAAGLLLERACKVPESKDDDDDEEPPAPGR